MSLLPFLVASVSNHNLWVLLLLFAKLCEPLNVILCIVNQKELDVSSVHGAYCLYIFSFQIYSAGFSTPTPIQAQTWPVALQGRDIVAIAKTGSGKTLGYLIPAFMILRQRRNNPLNGPTVLVLAPTRELATQIQDEAIKFGQSSRVSCTVYLYFFI